MPLRHVAEPKTLILEKPYNHSPLPEISAFDKQKTDALHNELMPVGASRKSDATPYAAMAFSSGRDITDRIIVMPNSQNGMFVRLVKEDNSGGLGGKNAQLLSRLTRDVPDAELKDKYQGFIEQNRILNDKPVVETAK